MGNKGISILIVVGLILIISFFVKIFEKEPIRKLPYYNKDKTNDEIKVNHIVPDFSFYNQNGELVTKRNLNGKIYVTDYFFTTCQSICPKMKKQMSRLYKYFLNENDILFVSHTVDPENDSVETLKSYSKSLGIDDKKWIFLTGEKANLYDLARNGYLMDASKGDGGADDFIHTQNFALVDKSFHIRGYYDGTDSLDVERLINEIKILRMEYE